MKKVSFEYIFPGIIIGVVLGSPVQALVIFFALGFVLIYLPYQKMKASGKIGSTGGKKGYTQP